MTCPACDTADMTFNMSTMREPPAWFTCGNCGLHFDDPRESVGPIEFDRLRLQHKAAVESGDESAKIRRGWHIWNRRTNETRLLTWIEIGAITGAI